jgi:hypothetical protein
MPMMFFYFLKIIFNISTSKRSKKYKPHLILTKKNSKFNEMQVETHSQTNITKGREDETFFSYRKDLKKIKNSPCSNSNIQKNRSYQLSLSWQHHILGLSINYIFRKTKILVRKEHVPIN